MRRLVKVLLAVSMASMIAVCSASCGCQSNGSDSSSGSSSDSSSGSSSIVKEGDFNYSVGEGEGGTLSFVSADESVKELVMKEPSGVKVTKIGNMAFIDYSDLEKIVLTDNIEEIGDSAFYGCRNLSDVNFPSSLKTIGGYAFAQTSLKEVELPSSVETIGAGAFSLNSELEKLTINEGVTKLEDICYMDPNLKELHLPSTISEVSDDVRLTAKTVVYTPENSVVIDYCKKNNIKYEIVK